jgi:NAD(P)H-hydrate epimerase
MASGGMGDALAGVLAARLGEVDDLFEACCQATWAHGRAGDLARDARGARGVTASSLIDHLHAALRGMEA